MTIFNPDFNVSRKNMFKISKTRALRIFLSILITLNFYFFNKLSCQPVFEHYNIEDGMSNNSIRRIIQDKNGFLWFGTLNGLNRFDGKNIRTFTFEPGNLNSLSSNRIFGLFEDGLGYIWILSFENHVLRFDPGTEEFINTNYLIKRKFNSPTGSSILYESSPGIVWIISDNKGLTRIIENPENSEFSLHNLDNPEILKEENINFVYKDQLQQIWIGSDRELIALKNDTTDFSSRDLLVFEQKKENISFTYVQEWNNQLIFGTRSNGLFMYELSSGQFKPWHKELNINSRINLIHKGLNNELIVATNRQGFYYFKTPVDKPVSYIPGLVPNSFVDYGYYDVYQDKKGVYWLENSRRGITMFNPEKNEIFHYNLNENFRESPGDFDKQTILEDSNGDLWIGIYGGGLFKYNRESKKFNHYFHSKNNPYSLSSNFVLCMFEDFSKNLWIGTFQGGLNKLELVKYKFNYIEPVAETRFKSENEVRSILEDQFGRVWIGTREGHIFCYNHKGEIIFKIPENLKGINQEFVKSNVYAMTDDNFGNLWIGTKGEGLFRISDILAEKNLKNKNFKIDRYMPDDQHVSNISYQDIFALFKDHFGQIWVGTYGGGIDIIKNPDADVIFQNYSYNFDDDKSISNNRIRHIIQDRDNNIWIGTSYGLNFLESSMVRKNKKIFKRYLNDPSDKNSLSNNDILFIHEDREGKIWMATYGGGLNELIKDQENNEYFKHFFRKDGLPSDVIFSILEDDNGNLWLGTENGMCKFSKDGKQIERFVAREGPGDNFYSEGTCFETENGEFIFGQKSGFVRFFPASIKRGTKEYPLVFTGFNLFDQRVVPGQKNGPLKKAVHITDEINLKYDQNFISIEFAVMDFKSTDKIQYSFILENFEEKWNYVTNQNKAVYRGLSPGKYIFKVKAKNETGEWIEEPKELKINIAPPLWRTKMAYTIYIIVILLLIWSVTYFISKEVRMRNEINYEKRLTEDKLMFYTNISHEFKTPLTLINSSTDDLLEIKSLGEDLKSKIQLIKKNSTRLHNLIEQLLDFRRIQKGKTELKTRKIEIISFLNDIYLTFLPLAEKKKIEFLFNTNINSCEGWIDPKHLEKIVINLLSNAFKHTPENKRILLDIHISKDNKLLQTHINDQGEGISKENLQKIFDRFAFIDKDIYNQFKGSGIGLSLSRDLATLHKGTIHVESEPKKGSVFTLEIPIDEESYSTDEKDASHDSTTPHQILPFQLELEDSDYDLKSISTAVKTSSAVKNQVLIIEDNDELRNYISEKLQKNFMIYTASDGEEGLKIANDINPDLILSDVKMPKIDGLELTKQLKNNFNTSHIPIILLTAKSAMEYKIEGLDYGADDYITKPFNMNYLQKRILNIINQRKILKEKFSQDPGFKPEKLTVSTNDQKFLTEVIRLVEENLKTPNYSIENIIEEMGYSRTVFYKKMKGISGYAPKEFIRIVKMKKAAALLREPDSSIAQVSYDIGYNDPDYFSKSFKNYFGEPPSEYQKKYR